MKHVMNPVDYAPTQAPWRPSPTPRPAIELKWAFSLLLSTLVNFVILFSFALLLFVLLLL